MLQLESKDVAHHEISSGTTLTDSYKLRNE